MLDDLIIPLLIITILGPLSILIKLLWYGWERDEIKDFIIASMIAGYLIIIVRYILIVLGIVSDN